MVIDNDLAGGYETYRVLMEDPRHRTTSMEFGGIAPASFEGAVADSSSAVIEYEGSPVPLAVAIDPHMPWYNRTYFQAKAQNPNGPIFYYNNMPRILDDDPEAYVEVMEPVLAAIESEGGLLVTDHVHTDKAETDRDIGFIAARAGVETRDIFAREKPPPRHYMYASRLLHTDRRQSKLREADFADIYETALAAGHFAAEKVVFRPTLDRAETDEVWSHYDGAFVGLNATDPVMASFPREEFDGIMADPEILKFAYMKDGDIANLMLMADVRKFPDVMNLAYYQRNFPEELETGNIYYSPGVFTKPAEANTGMSLSTMGLLIRGFCVAGIDPVITFACDEESNRQIPKLSARSVTKTGGLTTDFTYPDMLQLFRAYSVKRS